MTIFYVFRLLCAVDLIMFLYVYQGTTSANDDDDDDDISHFSNYNIYVAEFHFMFDN